MDASAGGRVVGDTLISVLVPLFNEREVLRTFHQRLSAVMQEIPATTEILYVDDGSNDGSFDIIKGISQRDDTVSVLQLSRNFGKEIAMTAGLNHVRGDAVVVIDADLQDPPELIAELVRHWRQGYDVVYAQREMRDGEPFLKRFTASMFYALMQHVGRVKIPRDTGDFRLLSRRAVDAVNQIPEQHRFMKGLFTWIGFPQKAVSYRRDPRHAGTTKWNYWRLWNFALEGITSFTAAPLKISTYIGVSAALVAFVYGCWIIIKTLLYGTPVPGYPSLMVVVLFLGGVQLAAIGILGEYVGRMFTEVKRRPLYFVNEYRPSATASSREAGARSAEGTLHGTRQ